jgi:hypothetical protein
MTANTKDKRAEQARQLHSPSPSPLPCGERDKDEILRSAQNDIIKYNYSTFKGVLGDGVIRGGSGPSPMIKKPGKYIPPTYTSPLKGEGVMLPSPIPPLPIHNDS